MTILTFPTHQVRPADPLTYLPCSQILDFRKGALVYNESQPATRIYLVIGGKVKITRPAGDGRAVLADIYRAEEFFGESALLRLPRCSEEASTIEFTRLMSWTTEQIEDLIRDRPELAIALLQLQSRRMLEYGRRIESVFWENTKQRLERSLIRFSDRLGTPLGDGS